MEVDSLGHLLGGVGVDEPGANVLLLRHAWWLGVGCSCWFGMELDVVGLMRVREDECQKLGGLARINSAHHRE